MAYISYMNEVDISKIDLKLLRVFRAVFEEGSVTKAATRLSLEQSLVSHSLNRLRRLLSDPLFVKCGRTIAPTEHASNIAPAVQGIIEQIESLAEPATLDLAKLSTSFRVSANDFERAVIAPHLARRFFQEAPNAKLSFANTWGDIEEHLRKREWDLVITPRRVPDVHDLYGLKLFEERYACFFDGSVLDPDAVVHSYGEQLHAVVRFYGNPPSPMDTLLAGMGVERDVRLIAPSFEALPSLMQGRPLVATLPSRLANVGFKDFQCIELPFPAPQLVFQMVWHSSMHHSPKHRWFRELVKEITANHLGYVGQ